MAPIGQVKIFLVFARMRIIFRVDSSPSHSRTMNALRAACIFLGLSVQASPALDYKKDIMPIMKEHCFECHREGKSKGSLILDNLDRFKEDHVGKNRPVVPSDPEASDLLRLMKLDPSDSDFMPRKGQPLPEKELKLIEDWIKEGAVVDAAAEGKTGEMKKPASPSPSQEFLSWTNKEGKELKARFMRLAGNTVVIATENGRSFNVPLEKLSDASVAQAKKLGGVAE